MAQAKQASRIFGAVTGAVLAASAVLTPFSAAAQEVTPAAQPQDTAWSDELRAFDQAATGARDYAEQNFGVGILIHVGEDFPNEHFATPEDFANVMVGLFEGKYETPARAFLRPNPGTANTGLTFHIGHHIHGASNGTEVKNVGQSLAVMPDIVEQLRIVKEVASLETDQPTLNGG